MLTAVLLLFAYAGVFLLLHFIPIECFELFKNHMYNAWFVFVAVLFVMVMLLFAVLKCCLRLMNWESSLQLKITKQSFSWEKRRLQLSDINVAIKDKGFNRKRWILFISGDKSYTRNRPPIVLFEIKKAIGGFLLENGSKNA